MKPKANKKRYAETISPKPCPFCGSDNLRVESYGVECRNCGVWMGDGTQRRVIGATVLEAWNHRVGGTP